MVSFPPLTEALVAGGGSCLRAYSEMLHNPEFNTDLVIDFGDVNVWEWVCGGTNHLRLQGLWW